MKNFGKWMLGAALLAGGLGLGATTAHAAEFRVYVGGNVAYVPPCPGPGYVWVDGYYNDGYWVPGYWNNVGVSYVVGGGYGYVDRDRAFYYRDRDDRRGYDRDAYRNYDRDVYRRYDRDDHRGYDRDDRRGFDRDDHRGYDREDRRGFDRDRR